MIQQHYYTRDRKGVYSDTPGYDTIAKSINLEDDFIVNYLHPLCFYEAPAILGGEEDMTKYPKALFCINTEDNKMVIGQSVFAGKDYTGKRNRYFTHNYIISEEEREEYIQNPEKIIFLDNFFNDYNIDNGKTIPEVSRTTWNKAWENTLSIDEMLHKTGIDEIRFKELILAAFHGALYKKKIYIVLNCELSELNILSKELLRYLYACIPFEVRRKIGFINYMKEPKNKDFINIIFLPKGSIKRLTTEIKAGYVFDFADNNFYLDDIDRSEHVFSNFAINNLHRMTEFFKAMDKLPIKNKLNITEYDNIINFIKEDVSFSLENIQDRYKEFLNINNKEKKSEKKPIDNQVINRNTDSNRSCREYGNLKGESSFKFLAKFIKKIKSFFNCK
ncbi:hypothetical protein [Clostridium lundense]|uniref:GAP1-N2 domain-containing protein n=1 Tax=Clostridium lundense TaxID=319475 RepID=UPI000687975F|nr:hypothetical protein [Clostridium lundense]